MTGLIRLVVEVPPTRVEGSERLINELADDLSASGVVDVLRVARGFLSGRTARAAVGRAGAVVTPSALLADRLRRLGIRVFQISPGVDCHWFKPPKLEERADSRAMLGIQPEERVVLHVGHAQPGRNLGVLAELTRAGHVVVFIVSPRFAPDRSVAAELRAAGVRLVTRPSSAQRASDL